MCSYYLDVLSNKVVSPDKEAISTMEPKGTKKKSTNVDKGPAFLPKSY